MYSLLCNLTVSVSQEIWIPCFWHPHAKYSSDSGTPVEIEVQLDGEVEPEEIMNYDEVQYYLANGIYPKGA